MKDGNPSGDDPSPSATPPEPVAALEEQLKPRTAELERERAARRELEERLASIEEQSRRQLAEIQADYDQSPVGLFVLDTELRYRRINTYLARFNGQPAAAHLGRTLREMVPGLADQAEPLFRHILQTGEPVLNLEIHGTIDDSGGDQRAWRAHYYPQRNPSGAIVGLTGMVEEVTALKRAERELRASEQRYRELSTDLERQVEARTAEIRAAQDALRESEARYRTIFDSVIDAIFIMDLEGNFLAVNEHACQRYGYSREDFLRLHITALNTPEDAVHVPARQAAVNRDDRAAFEAHHQDAQGQPLTVEVRARQILYDGRPAMLSVVRDVTARQRAAQALARSHAALEQAHALTHLGSWQLDFATDSIEWSPEVYRISGMEIGTPIRPDSHVQLVHPDDMDDFQTAWQATLNGAPYDITHRIIVQGEVKWVHAGADIHCDNEGRPQAALGTLQDITARTLAERALTEKTAALGRAEQQLRALLDTLPVGVAAVDLETHRISYVNECLCRMLGRERAGVLGMIPPDFFPAEHRETNSTLLAKALRGETAWEPQLPIERRDGSVFLAEVRNLLAVLDGRRCLLSVLTDITERQRAEARLWENEERFRRLFYDTRQPLSLIEAGRFIAVNQATLALLRLERPEQILGHTPVDFSPPVQPDGRPSAAKAAEMIRIAYAQGVHEFEWEHLRADGERFPAVILLTAISERNKTLLHVVWNDITVQKRAQEQAEYLAYHDALTGLPNRVLGVDHLAKMVAQARRHPRQLAVMYLDLDQFKHVNDRYGHLLGDRLLQGVSQRLAQQVREEDSFCRLAADEFMLVLAEVGQDHSLADLASLCDRLLTLMAAPFDLDGRQVHVGLSLGVALFPRDGTDGETLMRNADTALYVAKRAGRQTYRFFEPRMNDELARFIQTRDDLRDAPERREFVLHYQPQIALDTGRVVGVEALVRWQRPDVGLVMPGDFIDVAEESGLIVPIGRWVLVEACHQAAAWRAAGWPDLVMAVNLSTVQIRRGGIGAEVLAALEASGLDPAGLELELTESILLEDAEEVLATVSTWKAAGIQLTIDDFGTGYSSLAYLKRFQVDKLKIDRSFINSMADHEQDHTIVQAILDMAGGLKLRTIAEGVEDATLANQLRFMGCDEAQGYLYSPPLAAADLERWLRARGDGGLAARHLGQAGG